MTRTALIYWAGFYDYPLFCDLEYPKKRKKKNQPSKSIFAAQHQPTYAFPELLTRRSYSNGPPYAPVSCYCSSISYCMLDVLLPICLSFPERERERECVRERFYSILSQYALVSLSLSLPKFRKKRKGKTKTREEGKQIRQMLANSIFIPGIISCNTTTCNRVHQLRRRNCFGLFSSLKQHR